ncbi:coiled-coil domain-containing protein 137 [Salvia hispanica]|uniref:coiled-coil domain-containing protein 137 n=1 Tax=Salvia hispanica TaxID=49212 RepID=UPI0020097837|nr:coiled-coil domain-containing protein 137 [Salvia hispanica]
MGGKAIRRREKNYRAAHDGGNSTRLPPPPVASSIDALPSKLRKLMSFAGSAKEPLNFGKKRIGDGADKAARSAEGSESSTAGMKRKRDGKDLMEQQKGQGDEDPEMSKNEKKKKKRKSKVADDLRFKALDTPAAGSRRKERKKKLLEAKKKKQQKAQTEDDMDFRGREEIKFGDIVQAPPKLTAVPKLSKATGFHDASQERLRLQAVEAYRKRKGWESRPGIKLSAPVTTTSFF